MTDAEELRIIHALRLKGFADTDAVAEAAEVDVDDAKTVLDQLGEAEQAKFRDGRMSGWMLMPAGRQRGEGLLAAELDSAAKRLELDAIYRRFLELNQPFLGLCTDWQTRVVDGEQIVNDHSDSDYDMRIIDRLSRTDEQIQPICADLAAIFNRFSHYGPRFSTALTKVFSGELEWFTKPVIESYHTVWFELHEDLLASLGIERSKEGHA